MILDTAEVLCASTLDNKLVVLDACSHDGDSKKLSTKDFLLEHTRAFECGDWFDNLHISDDIGIPQLAVYSLSVNEIISRDPNSEPIDIEVNLTLKYKLSL